MEAEISIGAYSLPVILSVVMGVIYKVAPAIPDRWKALVSIAVGILIGLVAMVYGQEVYTVKTVIDYILIGGMAGAAAVGLYEGIYRPAAKPRE
jgi:hypothetical protein